MRHSIFQLAICALGALTPLFAADQTLTLNTPPRVLLATAIPGAFTPNMDIQNLEAVLTGVLGGAPADKTYYILHTVHYNLGNSTVESTNWFVYYREWAHPQAWQTLWDPDFRNHFKKARLFGTPKIILAYIQGPILGTLIDIAKVRAAVDADWAATLTKKIVAEQDATFPRPDANLDSYSKAAKNKAGDIVQQLKDMNASPPPSYPIATRVENIGSATSVTAVTQAYIAVLQDAVVALQTSSVSGTPGARAAAFNTKRRVLDGSPTPDLETAIANYLTEVANAQKEASLRVLETGTGTLAADLVDTDGNSLSCDTLPAGRFCSKGDGSAKLLKIAYRIEVTKKEPAPLTNFKLVLGVITGQSGPATKLRLPIQPLIAVNFAAFDIHHLPSDVLVKALLDPDADKPVEVASQKFDNEGRYRYDFSFAVPVKSLDKLEYSTTDGRVQSKSVQKQNIYAVANFYPIPIDTKQSQFRFVPGLMAGLAITGHPLDQQLYAGSIGLWKLEAFVGAIVSRQLRPSTAPNAKNGLAPDWGAHLTFGVNVPARTISDMLSKKK